MSAAFGSPAGRVPHQFRTFAEIHRHQKAALRSAVE